MQKNVIIPVVNRTNYSKLRGVLLALKKSENIRPLVVCSSGILASKTGGANRDIENDGIQILSNIDCLLMNDSLESMGKTVGLSTIEHSSLFAEKAPDALLVVGDRFDMLSPVLAAKILNIPIFHMQGGEESDSIDDTVRRIITVCADRHYVCTDNALEKVRRMTDSSHVYNLGCTALDSMLRIDTGDSLHVSEFDQSYYKDGFSLQPGEKYFLVIVHPVTTHEDDIDMSEILRAVLYFGHKCVVVYPNIDAFNTHLVSSIREYADNIICVKHCPLGDFVKLMSHSICVVGNSSSGIRETASFSTPCVNVGIRQLHRERNDNTVDCKCDYNDIVSAISLAMSMKLKDSNVYYKPNACQNVADNICEALDE